MREIDTGSSSKVVLPNNTFLIYGAAKSGKTTFAGTAPRPLFLSDGSEHGYESLREENWNNDETPLFEPGIRPIVWTIDKETDFSEAIEKARPLVEAGVIQSVWIDSLTFFADLVFNSILTSQAKPDTRKAYGDLNVRLRNYRLKVASLQVTHGWIAHAKEAEHLEDGRTIPGGPMIPGQQAVKFVGAVDFVWYTRVEQPTPNSALRFDVHTRRWGYYIAANRLGPRGANLPEPFVGNYGGFLDCLGYDVEKIRASLPPIEKARAKAKELIATRAKAASAAAPKPEAPKPAVTTVKPTVVGNSTTNGKTVATSK